MQCANRHDGMIGAKSPDLVQGHGAQNLTDFASVFASQQINAARRRGPQLMCDLNAVGDGSNTRNTSNCSCELNCSRARIDEEAVSGLEETGSKGRDSFLLVALRQQPV